MSRPLAYPEIPEPGNKLFWLALYVRSLAELNQLLQESMAKDFRRKNHAYQNAILGAIAERAEKSKLLLDYTRKDGLLLLAHASTTCFDQWPDAYYPSNGGANGAPTLPERHQARAAG